MNTNELIIFEKLYTRLYELLFNLNRYVPNAGCEAILQMYEKLDISMMMVRYLKVLGKYNDLIKTVPDVNENVESMFLENLIILPDINLSEIWPSLNLNQKKKIWTYIRLVYMTGFQVIEQSHANDSKNKQKASVNTNTSKKIDISEESDKKEKIHIDPFLGVGSNDQEYCVEDIYKNVENLEDIKYQDPGIGSLMSFMKLDKLIDVDKITDQLKNMTPEDIEKATNSIQSLLNTHDPHTQKFLKEMLDKIRDELKNIDLSQGTGAEKISKMTDIVGKVAKTMKPHVDNKTVDVKSMLSNAHGLFQEIATNKNMDPEQLKQMNALSSMFSNLSANPGKFQNKKYMNDMMKQAGVDPKEINKIAKSMRK